MHLKDFDPETFFSMECFEIAVISPGVTAETGMEAADVLIGLCDRIQPDAVIAIDALASGSAARLGTTVQISDTGIIPGGGVGNKRLPLNERVLGVPVIAIGVPTVIDARVFSHGDGATSENNTPSMFVSPREIDTIAVCAARIIAGGINQAFGTP
jgi:spore protease